MTNSTGRPSGSADAQNRERLISAARQHFSQRGFAASTTRDIARQAGTNPALIRYYFNNKAGLFQAVLHETLAPMLNLMQSPIMQSSQPDMLALVQQYHQMMAPHPELPRMIFRALHNPDSAEFSMVSEVFNGVIRSALQRLLSQLAKGAATAETHQRQALVISALALAVFPFLLPDMLRQVLQFTATPEQLNAIVECGTPMFVALQANIAGERNA